jgi:hypothetical protein
VFTQWSMFLEVLWSIVLRRRATESLASIVR